MESSESARLTVTLSPRAKTSALTGLHDGGVKIKIAAPPVDGAANQALLKFLAGLLDLPPARLALVAGQTGRRKIVKIEGWSEDRLWDCLNKHLKGEEE